MGPSTKAIPHHSTHSFAEAMSWTPFLYSPGPAPYANPSRPLITDGSHSSFSTNNQPVCQTRPALQARCSSGLSSLQQLSEQAYHPAIPHWLHCRFVSLNLFLLSVHQ
ncbi:hypothetical protein MPTK1_1g12800 [Marchantia polymorpha subsp. ruderalis]|uniref:Uncharacterized protein n=2 Tax=Marchantia polymorpha TaxID=3197 RepID=A0AAF6APH7_MARPO|nr:hypothetical protein MARPO_0019s0050 [Marchantia polymorpha]BBM98347.1 hypothetical protein Mp_1g12800 [Marchantia polymorpha subsp. ruderalis]|eukprot:PTQ44614.1 hypothetical protein MARPO_0019s0050 [Marchantia polymorpha]